MFKVGQKVVVDRRHEGKVVHSEDDYHVVLLNNGVEMDFEGSKRLMDFDEFDRANKLQHPRSIDDDDPIWKEIWDVFVSGDKTELKIFMVGVGTLYETGRQISEDLHGIRGIEAWSSLSWKGKVSFVAKFAFGVSSCEDVVRLYGDGRLNEMVSFEESKFKF